MKQRVPVGRVVTQRVQPRRPLSAIERKRFCFCAGCSRPIAAERAAELPVRDGEGSWHAGCWVARHPVRPASGARASDLYAED